MTSVKPARRRVRRTFTIVAVFTLAAAGLASPSFALASTSAPTANPYSPAYHHPYRHGAVPTISVAAQMSAFAKSHVTPLASSNNLNYGGAIDGIGVTTGHEKVYLVFFGSQWGSSSTDSNGNTRLSGDPSGEAPYLQQLFKGLGGGGERWSGVMTQYCQGVAAGSQTCPSSAAHVAYPTGGALSGVWVDTSSASPQQSNGHQLGVEAVKAAGHFGNTTAASNRNAQYVIASPTGTSPDGFIPAGFCAWHDYNGDNTLTGGAVASSFGDIAFTNSPYITDAGISCGQNFVNGERHPRRRLDRRRPRVRRDRHRPEPGRRLDRPLRRRERRQVRMAHTGHPAAPATCHCPPEGSRCSPPGPTTRPADEVAATSPTRPSPETDRLPLDAADPKFRVRGIGTSRGGQERMSSADAKPGTVLVARAAR